MTTTDQFPATLIISNNQKKTEDEISNLCRPLNNLPSDNNPDILTIGQSSGWGIDVVRKIKNFLSQKPLTHHNKIILIHQAQNLNTESQNALLKTLEEPGPDNYFILTAPNLSSLLATIISRVKIVKVQQQVSAPSENLLLITGNPKTDLLKSEQITQNKNMVLNILEDQLLLQKQLLIKNPTLQNSQNINKIIKTISMIKHNVDPKSALDYYFLY